MTTLLPASITSRALPLAGAPAPACRVSIGIPVRDEEASLTATLEALRDQRDNDGTPLDPASYEVGLLVNNARDGSAALARDYARRWPDFALHVVEVELPAAEAHVGVARKLLMDDALRRFAARPFESVVATTDADTVVAPDWVAATLAEIDRGVDAVAGRIVVEPAGFAEHGAAARAFHLRDVTYRALADELEARLDPLPWDPWPRHFQHFGPSMAATVAACRRAGGMPPLPALEDVAFHAALIRAGARVRHAPAVRVTTSARATGRAGFGFATQLRQWAEQGARGAPFMVEPATTIVARAAARRRLRWLVATGGDTPDTLDRLARALGVETDWLRAAISDTPTFGALWLDIEARQREQATWATRYPRVEIGAAIRDLRLTLAPLRDASVSPFEQIEPPRLLAAAD